MLISRDNGYVINTNFSSAFSQSLTQPRRAERVPFRMTRAIRYLMDGANPYGLFQRTCENVLTFMSEKRTLLVTQISILSSFAGVSAIEAVKDRLSGIDKNIDDEQRSAQQHVSKLIEVATNKQNSGAQADEWRAYW